jgi:5'-3' exonuclease
MNNYITDAGLIYWDRAEPFINMLGKHEHDSFKKRIHAIEHARYERIISFDPDFGKTTTKVDKAVLIKNKIKEKL